MKIELGKVPLEPKTKIEWAAQKLRIKPREIILTLVPYTANATLEVIEVVQKIKSIESNAPEKVIDAVGENLPVYIHLVATAAANGDEHLVQILRRSISKYWTMEQITTAAQIVYNSIDFAPMFQILDLMGKFQVASPE